MFYKTTLVLWITLLSCACSTNVPLKPPRSISSSAPSKNQIINVSSSDCQTRIFGILPIDDAASLKRAMSKAIANHPIKELHASETSWYAGLWSRHCYNVVGTVYSQVLAKSELFPSPIATANEP